MLLLMILGAGQLQVAAQLLIITNQPGSRTVWFGGNITLSVGASGAGPLSYQWQLESTNLPSGIIKTLAGNGTAGYFGDGGPGLSASLNSPQGVAVDAQGNLFVADGGNNAARRLGPDGIITTVAGNGTAGYSGDGGPATSASLNWPYGVRLDGGGNLFIADTYNNRIRKVDITGKITTVAGNGTPSYSGDGGAATEASLNAPRGVAVDATGNLLIADRGNHRIRKVNTFGMISTVAGNGTPGYSGDGGSAVSASLFYPQDVAADSSGALFIADTRNSRIRKVSATGITSTLAGDGTSGYSGDGAAATNAGLTAPAGVTVDSSGQVFIADLYTNRIRKVDTAGMITTVAGNGASTYSGDGSPATNASLDHPYGVAVDSGGNVFIGDELNNCIREVTDTEAGALVLKSVSAADDGDYQVLVTGPGNSVTSSVANLSVVSSPLILAGLRNPNGSLMLSFVSRPNSTNVVLCATNVSRPVFFWFPLSTNTASADGNWQYTDFAPGSSLRFYRGLME